MFIILHITILNINMCKLYFIYFDFSVFFVKKKSGLYINVKYINVNRFCFHVEQIRMLFVCLVQKTRHDSP